MRTNNITVRPYTTKDGTELHLLRINNGRKSILLTDEDLTMMRRYADQQGAA